MYKKFLWVAVFAFSLVLGQTAFAHSDCREGLRSMLESLKLDDAQKAKIKPILEQMKSGMKDNWTQMKDLRSQISQQVQSDNMDQATLDGLIDKKSKMMGDMMKAKANAYHQVFIILTAEQKSKFQAIKKGMEDKMVEKFKSCHNDQE